ncbi:MAG: hypothetical protein U5J98_06860 [Halobacteriales archaeon]|nr:hypothetical protein [Halobacteriales archaeon]
MSFSPSPDENYKVALEEGNHGGFEVLINTSRPEWTAAEEIDDDERRKQLQNRLGTLWGIEQIVLARNVDDLNELLSTYDMGDQAADDLTDRLYKRDELMAEIEAIVATEHGIGYE